MHLKGALTGFVINALMGTVIGLKDEWLRNWLMVRMELSLHQIRRWDTPIWPSLEMAFLFQIYRLPFGN